MAGGIWLAGLALAMALNGPAGAAAPGVDDLKVAAGGGDADAAYRLGRAYKLGDGAPADLRKAERWFEKAARAGHGRAGAELGLVIHQQGRSADALPWLRKAAQAGDPRAQYTLGTILFAGTAVAADPAEAKAWMRKAERAGLPAAREALSVMSKSQPSPVPVLARGEAPAAAAIAAPKPPRAGAWQVQLGAFSVAANATGFWQQLRDSDGRGLQASFPVRGRLTLLRVGPFATRGEARRFCSGQRRQGRDCVEIAGAGEG